MLRSVTLLATGFILAAGFLFLRVRRVESDDLARIQSRNLAQALDQSLSGTFQRIDQTLCSVVGEVEWSRRLGPIKRAEIERYLVQEGKLLPWPGIIWIADDQGRAIMGNRPISAVPPWAARWWFRHCRDQPGAGMVIAKPIIGFLTRKWVIPCVRRWNQPDGSFGGLVVIPLSVEYLETLLPGYALGAGGTLTLRDQDGGFIARYPKGPMQQTIGLMQGSDALRRFLQTGATEEVHVTTSPYDQVERMYAIRRVQGAPLMVAAGLAKASYQAHWRRDQAGTLAIMGLALAGVWIYHRLFRRGWQSQENFAAALTKSEERFRQVSTSIVDIAYACTRPFGGGFTIDWMIGGTPALLGRSIEEIMTMGCWGTLVVPEDRPLFNEKVIGLGPGDSSSCELRLARKDGGITWFESFAQCDHLEAAGGGHRVHGALVDITERKQAELTLRDSEAKLDLVLNSTAEAIYGMDLQGACTFCNAAFLGMTGFTRADEVLGRNVHRLIHHSQLDGSPFPVETCHFLLAMQGGRQEYHGEDERFYRADGTSFPVEYWTRLQRVDGHVTGVVVTFVNISERQQRVALQRQFEAELTQMQKLDSLGKLAGGVAHDMNNVLAAIQAVTQTLIQVRAEDTDLVRGMGIVEHATNRGRDLVKALTNFARKDIREAELLDLNTLVREEMAILERTTRNRVALVLELQQPLAQVLGEKGALGSALMNLCVNALDAMPQGGTLTLRTRILPEGMVALEVADTGAGMPPEVVARALEPFFTTKAVGKGTGLGLSSVYATAKTHGGNVSIWSEVGAGTVVKLTLPAVLETLPPPVAASGAPPPLRPLQVLLVDDDALIRATVPGLLALLGHRVSTLSGGEEALRVLAAGRRPDVLILDLNMPGMNGTETLRGIRQLGMDLPVLLATGHLDAEARDILGGDGRTLAMVKPFTLADLGGKLHDLGVLAHKDWTSAGPKADQPVLDPVSLPGLDHDGAWSYSESPASRPL